MKIAILVAMVLSTSAAAGARPLVAILAQNDGTEITDFLVPYGVIASAGGADVVGVSTAAEPVALIPGPFLAGLQVRVDTTIAEFDHLHPKGPDFVVIPAFHDSENVATRDWLRAQAAKGTVLVSICDGAIVLAGTGLLDGHRATGHFASAAQRQKNFPKVNWVANTRFVQDGKMISSSGVSASLPTALYLVELVAGRARALEVARQQGLGDYSATHDSDHFHLGAWEQWSIARNLLLGWPRDNYVLQLEPGVDEVGLAFAFDMLSRTFFARVYADGPSQEIATRHGLRVLRSTPVEGVPVPFTSVQIGGPAHGDGVRIAEGGGAPGDMLAYIKKRYGESLSALVATQLEYPALQLN